MKYLKKISIYIGISLLLLILLEFFIRFGGIGNLSYTDFDAEVGRTFKSNAKYVFFNEGFSVGKVNRYGYLGPSYEPRKPKNSYRAILLGDSYVEGFQLFDRDHFRSLLEKGLPEQRDEECQVLNMGKSGLDIASIYSYYVFKVQDFSPDLVICFISKEDLYPMRTFSLMPIVKYENDSLHIVKNYNEKALREFRLNDMITGNSALMNMGKLAFKKTKKIGVLPILLDKFYKKKVKPSIKQELVLEPIPEITYAIFNKFNHDQFIFIIKDKIPVKFIDYLNEKEFNYILLEKEFEKSGYKTEDIYHWEITNKLGHFNHNGHKIITDLILNNLNDEKN